MTLILRNVSEGVTQVKWDGTTGYALKRCADTCRDCYIEIATVAQYVLHQVPLSSTRVTNLLNYSESCVDPNSAVRRSVISIESNGMWNIWDKAVKHWLPDDPVANKLSKKRKNVYLF